MDNEVTSVKRAFQAPEVFELGLAIEMTKGCGAHDADSINGHHNANGACDS